MSLYEMIFGTAPVSVSKRILWSKLGKGELNESTADKLLAEGYEAINEPDDDGDKYREGDF